MKRPLLLVVAGVALVSGVLWFVWKIRLIGGATTSDYPAVALLSTPTCTATLVGPRALLTAAHCVKDANGKLVSVVSAHIPETLAPCARHPDFSGSLPDFDVAVCQLPTAATPTPEILAPAGSSAVSTPVVLVGYGCTVRVVLMKLFSSALPTTLQGSVVRIVSGAMRVEWQSKNPICDGDSGGPVFIKRANGHGPIVGVMSRDDDEPNVVDLTQKNVRVWLDECLAKADVTKC